MTCYTFAADGRLPFSMTAKRCWHVKTVQFNPFIWWPHTKEENVIRGRKKCCGRMNPVFNWMCSFKEMFSVEYFKMLLLSYIPCLFPLGIQEQLLWLCSQSRHCWCKSLSWGEKCHLKGSSCALLPDRLFICLQISDQDSFPPSLLPFCLLVTFFAVTSERRIYVRTYWSILTFWILELLCLTVMGCLVIFIIFRLLPPYAPYICESFSDDWSPFKRWKIKLSNISKNNQIS